MTAVLRWLTLLLGLATLTMSALAHRLDEYLQATLVTIDQGDLRLQINLTPGVAVAGKVLALVDRNHDGLISTNEAAAYCALLQHDLVVRLDDRQIALKLIASKFPELTELRTGWGIVQTEFSASIGPLAPGPHSLALKNRHLPRISVYLLNAAPPASRLIQITKQRRNRNQSKGAIDFVVYQELPTLRNAPP